MAIEVKRPSEQPLRNKGYLKTKLQNMAAEHKDLKAKWAKDHPLREPGTSLHTWKNFSRIRQTSPEYRQGYDSINWGNG